MVSRLVVADVKRPSVDKRGHQVDPSADDQAKREFGNYSTRARGGAGQPVFQSTDTGAINGNNPPL
jgi:hypothetical protein